MNVKTLLGCASIFASAFCFYMATVVMKWSKMAGLSIDSAMFAMARFAMGFVTVVLVMALGKKKIRIRKKRFLVGRALGNAAAVYCFFNVF